MRNLIELINGFYDLDIPNQIRPSSSFLFITLLRKFNGTKNKVTNEFFPDSLPIYNSELSHLTGIEDRTLRRSRNELTNFRLIESDDTTWILKYESRGTKESGIYTINYILLEMFDYGKYGNVFVRNSDGITDKMVTQMSAIDSDYGQNGNANGRITDKNVPLSKTKQNIFKQNSLLCTSDLNVHNNGNDKLKKTIKLIQTKFNQFTIDSKPIKDALIKISEYPEEQQTKALEKGSLETTQKKIVSYMLNGLEKGWYEIKDRSYGKATPDEWQPPERIEENLDPEYTDKVFEIIGKVGTISKEEQLNQLEQLKEQYNGKNK
jgi:hypothetical protein